MNSLPQIKPGKLEKVLLTQGFVPRSGKGSHVVYKHPNGKRTVIPAHNRPLKVGTLRAILKQCNLTVEEFLNLTK